KDESRAFDYVYEKTDRKLTIAELKSVVIGLRMDFQNEIKTTYERIRRELEAARTADSPVTDRDIRLRMPSEAELRKTLCDRVTSYALLARKNDHKVMFERITTYNMSELNFQKVMDILFLRE